MRLPPEEEPEEELAREASSDDFFVDFFFESEAEEPEEVEATDAAAEVSFFNRLAIVINSRWEETGAEAEAEAVTANNVIAVNKTRIFIFWFSVLF